MAIVKRVWHGEAIKTRVHHAVGRGLIGIGMAVSYETKLVTHVVTGTLRRSVHPAPAFYEAGEVEHKLMEGAEIDLALLAPEHATPTRNGYAIEVGSWMPYACVEWVGRGHPGVTQGLEAVRGTTANFIMSKAFREAGL